MKKNKINLDLDLIGLILSIVLINLVIIVLNIQIKECHDKGGKFARGYCVSNEVIIND